MANITDNKIDNATLGRSTTQKFFKAEDGYQKMVERWSALSNDKEVKQNLTASHHLLYLILRGKNLRKAFTPVTSERKLTNGQGEWGGYLAARAGLVRYNWTAQRHVLNSQVLATFDDLDEQAVSDFVLSSLGDKEPGYGVVTA